MSWSGELNASDEDDENYDEYDEQNEFQSTSEIIEKANDVLSRLQYYTFSHGLDMLTTPSTSMDFIQLIIWSRE